MGRSCNEAYEEYPPYGPLKQQWIIAVAGSRRCCGSEFVAPCKDYDDKNSAWNDDSGPRQMGSFAGAYRFRLGAVLFTKKPFIRKHFIGWVRSITPCNRLLFGSDACAA